MKEEMTLFFASLRFGCMHAKCYVCGRRRIYSSICFLTILMPLICIARAVGVAWSWDVETWNLKLEFEYVNEYNNPFAESHELSQKSYSLSWHEYIAFATRYANTRPNPIYFSALSQNKYGLFFSVAFIEPRHSARPLSPCISRVFWCIWRTR